MQKYRVLTGGRICRPCRSQRMLQNIKITCHLQKSASMLPRTCFRKIRTQPPRPSITAPEYRMRQKKVTAKQAKTKLRHPQTNIEMPVDDFLSLTCGPAAGPDVCSPMVAITDHNDDITAVFSINLSKLPKSFQNVSISIKNAIRIRKSYFHETIVKQTKNNDF